VKVASTAAVSPQDYIQQMIFRNPSTPRVYRCILEGFQRFVAKQPTRKHISQEMIRQWLNDRILVWPLHLVAHRARLVDRFLDWKVSKGALRSNPLAELRTECGQRSTTPVVRALLNADFRSALDAIRPAPRFFLGPAMREHVDLMKAVGYRYNVHEERMLRLDRFLQGRPDLSGQPLTVVIREWTNAGSTAQHAYECHATARSLSKALSRIDPQSKTLPGTAGLVETRGDSIVALWVMLTWKSQVIARRARSYEREDLIFDPLHYLALLEQKPNALDQAKPLAGWELPAGFAQLRRLMEARLQKKGKREYVQTLRLLETFALSEVAAAIDDALRLQTISVDAVKHLLLGRIERRPPRLDLENYPHLPLANVATTHASDYLALLEAR
jgi:hypothetical protein